MEAVAIVAGTANEEAAKTLLDWSITPKAMEMYNVGYAVVGIPGIAKAVEYFPEGITEAMIDNDFEWAANNRTKILEEWSKRYETKSEPKG
jgi:iron(III) transport system substrate-binding protein